MSNEQRVSIKCLFDLNRINSQYDLIPIIFYFPFGVCLLIIRLFIGLHMFIIANFLSKTSPLRCFILRTLSAILGIIVREENVERKRKGNTKIIIANHITNIDHLAIDLTLPSLYPLIPEVNKNLSLNKIFYWSLGYCDFYSFDNRDNFLRAIKNYLSSTDTSQNTGSFNYYNTNLPLLIQPECTTTNGKIGMLKFVNWPFDLGESIQPICISIFRPPPIKLQPTLLDSSWWTDLLYILFSPFTLFTLKYLEPVKKRDEESIEEFSKRVQKEMCNAIGLKVTNYNDSDKNEYIKRIRHSDTELNSRSTSFSPSINQQTSFSRVDIMARKVEEVLPQVPIDVIKKDLLITTDIDETITRLIEGTVVYEPIKNKSINKEGEPIASSSSTLTSRTNEIQKLNEDLLNESKLSLNTGAKNFGKTANERMDSYHERKKALIEASRLRYLKKHPNLLDELKFN